MNSSQCGASQLIGRVPGSRKGGLGFRGLGFRVACGLDKLKDLKHFERFDGIASQSVSPAYLLGSQNDTTQKSQETEEIGPPYIYVYICIHVVLQSLNPKPLLENRSYPTGAAYPL